MGKLEEVKKWLDDYLSSGEYSLVPLSQSGSSRSYFRLLYEEKSLIVAYNENIIENNAFFAFTAHFYDLGFSVPKLFSVSSDRRIYILEDFGDVTLAKLIPSSGVSSDNQLIISYYRRALSDLIRFQMEGYHNAPWDKAFPIAEFNSQALTWDLNYFKYYFLHLSGVQYHEAVLEEGFSILKNHLAEAPDNYLVYRDFQSRNIMVQEGELKYIDYQGCRKGAFYYDVASLLNQAMAKISPDVEKELLAYYYELLQERMFIPEKTFYSHYYLFSMIRILQTLGAYGYRGFIQQKTHFLNSVPQALKNLRRIVGLLSDYVDLRPFFAILEDMIVHMEDRRSMPVNSNLKVVVKSFSYLKEGIPKDDSGNGGGFVFDCRFLPNPGREQAYRKLTGLDPEVVEYFSHHEATFNGYLQKAYDIVSPAIDNYIERGFENLSVHFGCTGGQHRSVFCAENFAKIVRKNYNVEVDVQHFQMQSGYGF